MSDQPEIIEAMARAAWAERERWTLEGFVLGQCDKLAPWEDQAEIVKEDARREMRAALAAISIDFTSALKIARERFEKNPNWKRLDGTPWMNDAPVIAAELMCRKHISPKTRSTDDANG